MKRVWLCCLSPQASSEPERNESQIIGGFSPRTNGKFFIDKHALAQNQFLLFLFFLIRFQNIPFFES